MASCVSVCALGQCGQPEKACDLIGYFSGSVGGRWGCIKRRPRSDGGVVRSHISAINLKTANSVNLGSAAWGD